MKTIERRTSEAEILDDDDFGLDAALQTFRFLVPVNRFFGGIRPVLSFLNRERGSWNPDQTYHILDAGCGVGDVPIALAKWARNKGYTVRINGVDKSPVVAELARSRCSGYPEITITCRDVLEMHAREYDYVHASQFLHHFADRDVPDVLNHLLGQSRRQLVVNDLLRTSFHYAAAWFLGLFASPVFRHDSRISVRRGFEISELKRLLQIAGVDDFCLETHFFYRFLLTIPAPDPCY